MSFTSPSDAEMARRVKFNSWKKEMRSATRERARKHFWIRLAIDATVELKERDARPTPPRGLRQHFSKGDREALVDLRRLAIHRAKLEGATKQEVVASLPLSSGAAGRLFSREEDLTRTVEKQVWKRVTKRRARYVQNKKALARGETPSGRELPGD